MLFVRIKNYRNGIAHRVRSYTGAAGYSGASTS